MAAKNRKDHNTNIQTAPAPIAPIKSKNPMGWRKWLYRLLAMTAVPAFFLILLEGLLRLCGYGYPAGFFLTREIDGKQAYTDNPDFGRRFFPPGLAREIEPMAFAGTKAPGTYRIFILGESAAMGYPDSAFHFGRLLQALLQGRYPDARFEVINTAMTAINSHVILPIARDCTDHQPDLFVVYMGNNEVVGPYGASGVLGPHTPSLALIRASIQVKATRTGQLLGDLIRRAADSGQTSRGWRGMPMFVDNQVPADDPRLTSVYDHFSRNLQDICTAGQNAGAKVLVCTVASNLKDSAPFASVPTANLSDAQTAQWKKHYEAGINHEVTQEPAAAVASYRRALAIDDKPANLHFRLARCLVALKQPDEARRHFVLARDLDALRFRADTTINEAIRGTAQGREDEGVYLVDVEEAFAQASPGRIPGEELFYEHVHLTFEGNYQLARAILEQMDRILPDSVRPRGTPSTPVLPIQECQDRLPFTDWNRQKGLSAIAIMAQKPPFTNQVDHKERQVRRLQQLAELKKRLDAKGTEEAMAAYRRALKRDPQDLYLLKDFAVLLGEQGQLDEAVQHTRQALKLVPHDPILRTRLALLLARQDQLSEALAFCAESLKVLPDNPDLHNLTGQLLITAGKPEQAISFFMHGLEFKPHDAAMHTNLGDALALLKQHDKAIAEFNEALRIDPDFVLAHQYLGRLLNQLGRFDESLEHYHAALRIDPNHPERHAEIAAVWSNKGNVAQAIFHLKEAKRIKPNWPEVDETLRQMEQTGK